VDYYVNISICADRPLSPVPSPTWGERYASPARRALPLLGLLALAACASASREELPIAPTPESFPGESRKTAETDCASTWIAPGKVTVGALRFEGGFELKGTASGFGGLSGLEAVDDHTLLAIEDVGRLVRIEIARDAGEEPVARCKITRLVDDKGQLLTRKREADSEDLALLGPDRIAVSFERDHRVAVFALPSSPDNPSGDPVRQIGPGIDFNKVDGLQPNLGLEALALLPSGVLIAGAESPSVLGSTHPVWRIAPPNGVDAPPAPPRRASFDIADELGFSLVSFRATPGGGLVVLERFYSPALGWRSKIGWLPESLAETATGTLHPFPLGRLNGQKSLSEDNFEGIAALAGDNGRTDLWIVSDDNFSSRQKTLLYHFSFDERVLAADAGD
jgi:hypothetical protein